MCSPLISSTVVSRTTIPSESWIQDREIGGGRIIGEGCHFLDFARFIAGRRIIDVNLHPLFG